MGPFEYCSTCWSTPNVSAVYISSAKAVKPLLSREPCCSHRILLILVHRSIQLTSILGTGAPVSDSFLCDSLRRGCIFCFPPDFFLCLWVLRKVSYRLHLSRGTRQQQLETHTRQEEAGELLLLLLALCLVYSCATFTPAAHVPAKCLSRIDRVILASPSCCNTFCSFLRTCHRSLSSLRDGGNTRCSLRSVPANLIRAFDLEDEAGGCGKTPLSLTSSAHLLSRFNTSQVCIFLALEGLSPSGFLWHDITAVHALT